MFENLLPDPLHPAVVHLPIALVLLLPVFAVGALVAIRRGTRVLRAWGIAAAMAAALSGSAFVALETGEMQEDRVEDVVPDRALDGHEDAATGFLAASLVVLGVALVGLARGKLGNVARHATVAGSLVLLGLGYRVGHSGGELVYRYGAASAYAGPSGARTAEADVTPPRRRDDRPRR
jgi:uncharacterized membrane protein